MPLSYIAYYRVSTERQAKSGAHQEAEPKKERNGLGLEAQRQAVTDYLKTVGGTLIEAYTEVESGKKNNRPQLAAAMKACRKQKATLIIAKLDRLARNVHFITGLMESGVKFIATDMPDADEFMIHIHASVAQWEGKRISQRTKDALAVAKSKGTVLGRNGREVLAPENRRKADNFAAALAKTIGEIKAAGFKTIRAIAAELNRRAIPTARPGAHWQLANTHALLRRIERQNLAVLKLNL